MPVFPGDPVYRESGSGTTRDPKIMWLVAPPRDTRRTEGNEDVARDLGAYGYTHIWIRACDHPTTRKTVVTRGGHRTRRMVRTDNHITVFARDQRSTSANKQGDIFLVSSRSGRWRIMRDGERTDRRGRGVELYPFHR